MRARLCTLFVALCLVVVPLFAAQEFDDCEANFIAFVGANAYQFSPRHTGELGTVRLYTILSYQRAAHEQRHGWAYWKLTITRAEDGSRVTGVGGRSRINAEGASVAELWWDGRDDRGRLVEPGRYRYTFEGRFWADRKLPRVVAPADFDGYLDVEERDEAMSSSDEVIVDYDLTPASARLLRETAAATSCQIQQNVPIEAGFGFNFYYGSTHAHSNWSDGGQPTTNCSSGNSYGSGTFDPMAVFGYARNTAGLDFWVINEHNHLIQDAIATNNPPVTEAKVKQRYADGRAAANSATVDGSFVGVYGMEWGVSTNSDQGHVTLLETPKLFGWETCSTCNGPSAECTPGTNCYFDVFTPKRFGYLTLYQRSVENPSPVGALGIFCHPDSSNFDNFAFNANADNAMQGIAVRSGLAFANGTDCATANIASSDYSGQWKSALNKGFHIGPTADHDSHCNNFGTGLPTRTVYLIPNSSSPVLTKNNLLAAHRARHFYASEDPNLQLVFRTADGSKVMGDIFDGNGGADLRVSVNDPNGEATSTIEIWRGQIGGGVPAAAYRTWSNTSSAQLVETLTSGTYYYFVHLVQADGHDAWSAPMWITFKPGGGDTTLPTTSITAPLGGATVSNTITVSASASDNIGVTKVEFFVDGVLKATDTTSPYSFSWDTKTSTNGAHSLTSKAHDAALNIGTSAAVSVTVSNDLTLPTTSITAPLNGATVSNTVAVNANASDNVGVTKVEFYLDGVLKSTDTTSPYSWSWLTTSTPNGAHALTTKAYDAQNNIGNSAAVNVTVNNVVPGTNIGGWTVVQANSSITYTIPSGTTIPANGYVVIGRDATKAQFEAFWGVTLGASVVYINSAAAFPQINGSETYTLNNSAGTKIDGTTPAMASGAGESLKRINPCTAGSTASNWTRTASSTGTPGSGAAAGCAKGVVINEFCDALGTGNFVYEFVELHNDN